MGTKWGEGTYLGHSFSSNTYVLGAPKGLEEARAIQRRPESERWSADALADIAATPWSTRERPETRVIFQEPAEHGGQGAETAVPAAAGRLRINQRDLDLLALAASFRYLALL